LIVTARRRESAKNKYENFPATVAPPRFKGCPSLFVIGFRMNATPGLHCISWGIASSTLRLSPQEMMKLNSTSRFSILRKTFLRRTDAAAKSAEIQ
jgi:hypothetical protein